MKILGCILFLSAAYLLSREIYIKECKETALLSELSAYIRDLTLAIEGNRDVAVSEDKYPLLISSGILSMGRFSSKAGELIERMKGDCVEGILSFISVSERGYKDEIVNFGKELSKKLSVFSEKKKDALPKQKRLIYTIALSFSVMLCILLI